MKITYQGIPCRSVRVSYARGYAAGVASVVIWVADWPEGFSVQPAQRPAAKDGVPPLSTQARSPEPVRVGPGRVLEAEGELVLEGDGSTWSRRMLVLRSETSETGGAGNTQLLTVTLLDEAAVWERGAIGRWSFNRLRADGTVAADSAGPGGRLLNRGEIVSEVVSWLPRRPDLVAYPEEWDEQEPSVELQPYQLSAAALAELMEGLSDMAPPCLRLDGSLALHRLGDGMVGYAEAAGEPNTKPFPLVIHDSRKDVVEWGYPDDAVLVVGGPRVATIALDAWEPVILLTGGRVRPLDDETLLELTGQPELNLEWLSYFVLAPSSYQGHPLLDPDVAALLADQAWRIYRMPGAVVASEEVGALGFALGDRLDSEVPGPNAHLLPMLDRAEVDPSGRRQAPLVQAYSHGVQHVTARRGSAIDPATSARYAAHEAIGELRRNLDAQRRGAPAPNVLPPAIVDEDALQLTDVLGEGDLDGLSADEIKRAIEHARRIEKARRVSPTIAGQLEQQYSELWRAEEQLGKGNRAELHAFAQAFLEFEKEAAADRGALETPAEAAKRLQAREAVKAAAERLARSLRGAPERSLSAPTLAPSRTVGVLANLPRREDVGATVLDAERGLIETSGLPGWLEDEEVPSPECTRFVPKPVRVLFGATLRPRLLTRPQTERVLTGEAPEEGELGDVAPAVLSDRESLYRSAWRREGTVPIQVPPEELDAELYEVTPVHDPSLVELVPFEGGGNKQRLDEAAFQLVAPRMARAELSRTQEVTAPGPWPVQLDGVVAAVEIESTEEDGAPCGFLTRVYTGEAPPTPAVSGTRERPPGDVRRFARPDRREAHS